MKIKKKNKNNSNENENENENKSIAQKFYEHQSSLILLIFI